MTAAVPAPRTLVILWLSAAAFFGALLVVARLAEGPLDDTDPAFQRPGFLDAGSLPVPAVTIAEGVPAVGRRSVVFFTRPDRLDRLCHALASHQPSRETDVAIIVSGPEKACAGGPPVFADPDDAIADAYGMREPRAGGAPVGYAVVDADRLIRYRTLDPTVHDQLAEVDTILDALP